MTLIWQDIVLTVVGFGFSLALIPTIMSKDKPPKLTCLLTGVGLLVNAVCVVTLDLWLAFASTLLSALAWFILLFQRRSR